MTTYRVIAPYVTLKVKGDTGGPAMVGFYRDAVVTDEQADKDSLKRHVDRKMVERVSTPTTRQATKKAESAKTVEPESKSEPEVGPKSED